MLPSYEELLNKNEYANTVLSASGRNFNPVEVTTGRGIVRVEQLDVARQNLGVGMCTCGQHAVTQADIIANALRDNNLAQAQADLLDRQFMGISVQQTCHTAKKLVNLDKNLLGNTVEPQQGWTEATMLQLLLQQNVGTFFVGDGIDEKISPYVNQPHPEIVRLNAAGIHRVILNVGAHWISMVIDRPAANTKATYYLADSAGSDRRSNSVVRQIINRLESIPAAPTEISTSGKKIEAPIRA